MLKLASTLELQIVYKPPKHSTVHIWESVGIKWNMTNCQENILRPLELSPFEQAPMQKSKIINKAPEVNLRIYGIYCFFI